ncbi:hypothetical protein HS125_08070 [bacterium]|nr:hypothetical protein [bacterium]
MAQAFDLLAQRLDLVRIVDGGFLDLIDLEGEQVQFARGRLVALQRSDVVPEAPAGGVQPRLRLARPPVSP